MKSEVEQTKVSPVYCLNLKSKKQSTLMKELIPVLEFILRKKKKKKLETLPILSLGAPKNAWK